MTDAPRPPITADVDLRAFHFMPLDIVELTNSDTWLMACTVPYGAAACINLWCKSWHQVPAGSLPDNDAMHRMMAGVPNWDDVRDVALRNFVKCSDGRLYHKTICAKAKEAWNEKQRYRNAANARWKNKKSGNPQNKQRTKDAPQVASKTDDAKPHASHMQETGTGTGINKNPPVSPPGGPKPKLTFKQAVDCQDLEAECLGMAKRLFAEHDWPELAWSLLWDEFAAYWGGDGSRKKKSDWPRTFYNRAVERRTWKAFAGAYNGSNGPAIRPDGTVETLADPWGNDDKHLRKLRLRALIDQGAWADSAGEKPTIEAAKAELAELCGEG